VTNIGIKSLLNLLYENLSLFLWKCLLI